MSGRDSYRWKQRVARERARLERKPELAVCWLCGQPIDMTLPRHRQFPGSFTLDHVVPLARGGDIMGESKPAHHGCNSGRREGGRGRSRKAAPLVEW